MNNTISQDVAYQLEGTFLGFLPDSNGQLKHIQIQVGERILPIKIAKEVRKTLIHQLIVGDAIAVSLEKISSQKGKKIKLKSSHVVVRQKEDKIRNRQQKDLSSIIFETSTKKAPTKTGKILLCRKSSCSKRGGKQLDSALRETLKNLGIQDRVKIELTGCQKQCKKAPSLILTPGKKKHTYVNPQELEALLKSHYL